MEVGEAVITDGFGLQCKHIIHAVGPQNKGGDNNEENGLFATVVAVFDVATTGNIKSVSIPAISCGIFGISFSRGVEQILEGIVVSLE